MSKRMLQIILVLLGLTAIVTGTLDLIPSEMSDLNLLTIKNDEGIILDSNVRYYCGVWLGLGIVLLLITPSIEKHKTVFRSICLMIFIGAIGRTISMFAVGIPIVPFVIITVIEYLCPLLILWQNAIAKSNS